MTVQPQIPNPQTDVTLFHRAAGGELIAVRPFVRLQWTRSFVASGTFRLETTVDHGAEIQCGDSLDIELAGRRDFTGIVQHRTLLDRAGVPPLVTIEGLDLTWWLHQRVIVPPPTVSHDEQIDVPAESAIHHYIQDHLLSPTDALRTIPQPATLDPLHDPPLGPNLTVRARYINLARQVQRLATQAGLGLEASRDDGGLMHFAVRTPSDHGAASAQPVRFTSHDGLVARLAYVESAIRTRNAVYVLGAGDAENRLVELVTDDTDIALRHRRELALDARDADVSAAAIDAGRAELARQALERVRVELDPLPIGAPAYRDDWDLGHIVAVEIPDLGLTLDQRIESVRLSLDAEDPLRIECALGASAPDAAATLQRIDERTAPGRFA